MSDEVVLRVQSLSGSASSASSNNKVWRRDLKKMLSPVFGVSEVRPTTLTYNTVLQSVPRMQFLYAGMCVCVCERFGM